MPAVACVCVCHKWSIKIAGWIKLVLSWRLFRSTILFFVRQSSYIKIMVFPSGKVYVDNYQCYKLETVINRTMSTTFEMVNVWPMTTLASAHWASHDNNVVDRKFSCCRGTMWTQYVSWILSTTARLYEKYQCEKACSVCMHGLWCRLRSLVLVIGNW